MAVKEKGKKAKPKAKPKTAKVVKKTEQEVKMVATITDKAGNVSEFTKPFGENIIIMENMANVGFSYAETINIGDYNNVKFQASLHVPCDIDDISPYFKGARKKVMAWAEEIKADIESQI